MVQIIGIPDQLLITTCSTVTSYWRASKRSQISCLNQSSSDHVNATSNLYFEFLKKRGNFKHVDSQSRDTDFDIFASSLSVGDTVVRELRNWVTNIGDVGHLFLLPGPLNRTNVLRRVFAEASRLSLSVDSCEFWVKPGHV